MSLFLLGVAVGFLALAVRAARPAAARRHGEPGDDFAGDPAATPAVLALAYGAPALILAFVLWWSHDDATRFRFSLLGLGFRGEVGEPITVAVGGDREEHEVWISALAEERSGGPTVLGRLTYEPTPDDLAGARLRWRPAAGDGAGEAPGLAGIRSGEEPLRPLAAVELRDGDRIHLAGRVWVLRLGGLFGPTALFTDSEGREVEIPRRHGELPLVGLEIPIWRPHAAAAETYPLAWLTTSGGEVPADAPRGFFFWRSRGWSRSHLWLAATLRDPADPAPDRPGDVVLERGGEPLAVPAEVELSPDTAFHVLSPPRWDGHDFRAGGIRDRRSFRWRPGEHSFALIYDTPEIYVLPRASLGELAITPPNGNGEDAPLRLHLSMGGWQITDRSLHFEHASRKVALEALATLEIPQELLRRPRRGPSYLAATPRGQRHAAFGEPVWLGGEHLAAVQVDLLSPPRLLGLLALLLAALKVTAARSGRLSGVQLLVAAPLEALLAVRLLTGYRAWVLPPFEEEAYQLALIAWSLLPWTLLLLCARRAGDELDDGFGGSPGGPRQALTAALPALGGLLFSAVWCGAFVDGFRLRVWWLCHLLVVALWAARFAVASERLRDAATRIAEAFARLGDRLGRVELLKKLPRGERAVLWLWVLAGFAPGLLRVALVVLGARESLVVGGQRIALTLLHVPLAIVLEAAFLVWLWRRIGERGRLAPFDLAPALAILLGTWLVPALVVSDLGLFLLNVPVFLIALSSLVLVAGRRLAEDGVPPRQRWLHWTPAAALVLYLLFAAFPVGARALIAALPRQATLELGSERNYLRLLAFAYPKQLERLARRGSEELMVMSTVMRSYTSGPFFGRGYFSSELSPHLEATALREHAPTVFLAAEWGLAGILGVLLLYLVAAGGRRAAPWHASDGSSGDGWADRPSRWRGLGGAVAGLSALTFAIPSIYMVLANYRLTLFTGKNAYLLGLDSTADVLETLALVLLFALGSAIERDREDL